MSKFIFVNFAQIFVRHLNEIKKIKSKNLKMFKYKEQRQSCNEEVQYHYYPSEKKNKEIG
jgi:hypothetical protein